MHLVFWGTYDRNRPRNRIHLNSLQAQGIEVSECHGDAWGDRADKSQIKGRRALLRQAWGMLSAYLRLVYRYLKTPRHDVVMVGYLGLIDVFVIWPFAKLRGKPIVWDALMSLYNTLVIDRQLFDEGSLRARALFYAEWLACRLASKVVVTTAQRRQDFIQRYGIAADRIVDIPVGAEYELFPPRPPAGKPGPAQPLLKLLFYGNFLPLHGVTTIVRAAQIANDKAYHWTLIGQGQCADAVRELLQARPVANLHWVDWVEYEDLYRWIHAADLCLGIFGASDKARETIPNKIYQILATGTALVTRDSPAMRELTGNRDREGLYLVEPESPQALLEAIERYLAERTTLNGRSLHEDLNREVADAVNGKRLLAVLTSVTDHPRKS